MRILIADDDDLSRRMLRIRLEKWGHEVVSVRDGREAWSILETDSAPRLAILDWMMPEMDGVEVCQRLRAAADRPYVYAMMLTAREDTSDVVAALEAGADDYLTKPYDTPELRARIGVAERFVALHEQLEALNAELTRQALTDALTGLLNRGAAMRRLEEELSRAGRLGAPLTVFLCDIDHFKRVNDTHGHPAGDVVLTGVASRLRKTLRGYSTAGRYGGEEFIIIVPGLGMADAGTVGERLRAMVCSRPFHVDGHSLDVTVSIGAAVLEARASAELGLLVKIADHMLYAAKDAGRNCCHVALYDKDEESASDLTGRD